MRVLLSNDDGIDSPGLVALEHALSELGEVWVVAPASEQSAKSHALTLHNPLRVTSRGTRRFAVSGTPADCVYLGLHGLLPSAPDVVVSGINRGGNLGTDVYYSGTVAAAREAAMAGVPALAMSLHIEPGDTELHWESATPIARRLARRIVAEGLPKYTMLNVNVPNTSADAILGVHTARLGVRIYEDSVCRREDPMGRPYYWIGGTHDHFLDIEGSDGPLIEAGWATVTPLQIDPTHSKFMDVLREWNDA